MTDKKEWLRRRNEDAKQAHAALMKFYPLDLEDLDGEEWKPIPDFEELYQVSNFGRVKSLKGRWDKIPRIMKPVLILEYMYIKLCKAGKSKIFRIHRLVAQLFIPKAEGKEQVNHRDKIDKRIPDEVRSQIRAEYKPRISGHGCTALAKKYGVCPQTILNIIKGK